MRVNDSFILRTIADENLLIPTGTAALEVQGLISLSESGALLYQKLLSGSTAAELAALLTAEYDIDLETAQRDTADFLDQMRELGVLAEE